MFDTANLNLLVNVFRSELLHIVRHIFRKQVKFFLGFSINAKNFKKAMLNNKDFA